MVRRFHQVEEQTMGVFQNEMILDTGRFPHMDFETAAAIGPAGAQMIQKTGAGDGDGSVGFVDFFLQVHHNHPFFGTIAVGDRTVALQHHTGITGMIERTELNREGKKSGGKQGQNEND